MSLQDLPKKPLLLVTRDRAGNKKTVAFFKQHSVKAIAWDSFKTVPLFSVSKQIQLKHLLADTLLFTSLKSVKIYLRIFHPKDKAIIVVGESIKKYLEALGHQVLNTIASQSELKTLSYFQNKRRFIFKPMANDSLPMVAFTKKHQFFDWVCYKKILTQESLVARLQKEKPDAILFYSPSALKAFTNCGGQTFVLSHSTPLFLIGATTAKTAKNLNYKNLFVAPKPESKAMFFLLQKFFKF